METYIVLASFSMDDVPVFWGTREACMAYCRIPRTEGMWDELRRQAGDLLQRDIGSECIAFHILRLGNMLGTWCHYCVMSGEEL